jgi:hypothetical protein
VRQLYRIAGPDEALPTAPRSVGGKAIDVVLILFMALLCVPCEGVPSSPVEIRAGQLSFQPEALGAGQEVTIDLKHFEKRPHVGVSGSCGPQCE